MLAFPLGDSKASRPAEPGESFSSSPASAASNSCLAESIRGFYGPAVIRPGPAGVKLDSPGLRQWRPGWTTLSHHPQEHYMKKLLSMLAATGLALSFATAHAADTAAPAASAPAAATAAASKPAKAPTAQQGKMTTCNAEAKDKKGDERKAFMKECLSAKKPATQQDKMKTCNADAKTKALKGDERKAFMKECLSGK